MPYAISGGHKKTIEAAEIILNQGGNAVDAAIAAYLVSFIAEPCMASIGAGGFAMINDTHSVKMVDFFCQTPKIKKAVSRQEFFPITVDFGNTKEDFQVGKGSIAVPGAIAGIYKMHALWGKIPMAELFAPAMLWSKQGIAVDKFQAYDFKLLSDIFHLNPDGRKLFFDKKDELKREGDIIKMPQFNDFLEALVHEGKDLFYKGEISRQVSEDMRAGGHLTRADFEEYQANIVDPIYFDFLDHKICTTGFPSVGGMLITAILNVFQDAVIHDQFKFLSLKHFQTLVQTFATVGNLNNDPLKITNFLFKAFGINASIRQHGGAKWGGTSHFNVVDKDGMTVCLTTSIGEGAGYFIDGTDMQMNNMLGEEALMPNGFHNWKENVRLQSMMSPTIVLDKLGHSFLGIGSGGAGRIPYAISQAIINLLYFQKDAMTAVEAPRVHIQGKKIEMETGFNMNHDFIENLNVWDEKTLFFGGTNIIHHFNDRFHGVADNRRFGAVINNYD
ncbi:MAG: gamma-glutamyltransferase [Saprospiraceae bacterium]|nr:gamma-glutamyltransferase [Saprospiraceae bacterium]